MVTLAVPLQLADGRVSIDTEGASIALKLAVLVCDYIVVTEIGVPVSERYFGGDFADAQEMEP
jgi:hypothetical protein